MSLGHSGGVYERINCLKASREEMHRLRQCALTDRARHDEETRLDAGASWHRGQWLLLLAASSSSCFTFREENSISWHPSTTRCAREKSLIYCHRFYHFVLKKFGNFGEFLVAYLNLSSITVIIVIVIKFFFDYAVEWRSNYTSEIIA